MPDHSAEADPGDYPPQTPIHSFEQQLLKVQACLQDGPPEQRQTPSLGQLVSELQTIYRSHLLPLASAQPEQTPLVTEINRHLRLLSIDATFLQAARQLATRQQRTQQIQNRLVQLLGFTRALITALTIPTADPP